MRGTTSLHHYRMPSQDHIETRSGSLVRYIAVARISDATPIATYTAQVTPSIPEETLRSSLNRILGSPRLNEHVRLTITDGNIGHWHYERNSLFLYLVLCDHRCEQRQAFQCIAELRHIHNEFTEIQPESANYLELSPAVRERLEGLAQKWDSLMMGAISHLSVGQKRPNIVIENPTWSECKKRKF